MNNVKETITEGVNNAMVYRVYAGVDVTFLQSGDLVRRVMYCIMSEQVRDSYEKI